MVERWVSCDRGVDVQIRFYSALGCARAAVALLDVEGSWLGFVCMFLFY